MPNALIHPTVFIVENAPFVDWPSNADKRATHATHALFGAGIDCRTHGVKPLEPLATDVRDVPNRLGRINDKINRSYSNFTDFLSSY
jgi:hypothetical protein